MQAISSGAVLSVFLLAAPALAAPPRASEEAAREQRVPDQVLVQTREALPALVDPYDDLLESTGVPALDALLQQEGAVEMRRVVRRPPRGWRDPEAMAAAGLDRWVEVSLDHDHADIADLARRIALLPAVQAAVPQRIRTTFDTTPNDPSFGSQWALQNNRMGAKRAWDHGTSSPVVVAITDTGADMNHSDLKDNIWINTGEIRNNGIDDDLNGYIDDRKGWDFAYDDRNPNDGFGHGVHVSGIVGAVGNNANQVTGTCWDVPLMQCKVLNDGGSGYDSDLAAGMLYAAENGAGVMNMSWGGSGSGGPIQSAVDYAASVNVLMVAAAGNTGGQGKIYPAGYGKVMAIISTHSGDGKSSFSTYGTWCDMAAPGESILNTYLNDGLAYLSGTSMAAPHVAGAAALALASNPDLDSRDLRWLLAYSSKDLGANGFDGSYGWGRLDLDNAIRMARALKLSATVAQPKDQVQLDLDLPGESGFVHVILPSFQNRRPGISLSGFDPGDHRQIAINEDPLLFPFLFSHPTNALFSNFVGTLDAAGRGTAYLNIPGGSLFASKTLTFVGLTFDPADLSRVASTTTSVQLRIQP